MTLVHEGDTAALAYLNTLPPPRMRSKVRAKPFRPVLLKWNLPQDRLAARLAVLLDESEVDKSIFGRFGGGGGRSDQPRVPAGQPGGGEFASGGGGGSGDETPKPDEGSTKGWAPHMTAEKAAEWQRENGATKPLGPLYHGTESWRAERIASDGFRSTGPASNAQVYGQGTYLTTSEALAHWKYAGGKDEGTLETRVCLTNPASLGQTREVIQSVKDKNPDAKDVPSLIRQEAESRGFDALRVEYYEPVMGRDAGAATNYVVFDPQKVTVIDKTTKVYKDWQDQPRDAHGRWGSGGGEERPTFPGSVLDPVQHLADGRDAYIAAHPELGAPGRSDIDYSKVAADPVTGKEIADLYDKAPAYDPAAQAAYDQLKAETAMQYDYLTKTLGITVEVADHDPYKSVSDLVKDIQENHHQYTLATAATGGKLVIPETGKPIFTNGENDKFRAVHDAFGHAATGRAFDRNGEAAAWASHMQMFSPLAGRAVTTETHARNSVLIYGREDQKTGPAFAAQKVFLLPERLGNVDDVIPGRAGKALSAQASADADNLYDKTHCHHTSQGRYLPGSKKKRKKARPRG